MTRNEIESVQQFAPDTTSDENQWIFILYIYFRNHELFMANFGRRSSVPGMFECLNPSPYIYHGTYSLTFVYLFMQMC